MSTYDVKEAAVKAVMEAWKKQDSVAVMKALEDLLIAYDEIEK